MYCDLCHISFKNIKQLYFFLSAEHSSTEVNRECSERYKTFSTALGGKQVRRSAYRFRWTGSSAVTRYSQYFYFSLPSFSFPAFKDAALLFSCLWALLTFILIYVLVEEWRLWLNIAPQKLTRYILCCNVKYYLTHENVEQLNDISQHWLWS